MSAFSLLGVLMVYKESGYLLLGFVAVFWKAQEHALMLCGSWLVGAKLQIRNYLRRATREGDIGGSEAMIFRRDLF
ncbi:hypothetical protein [Pareuzebyella sediminis]|uniref:hypothetical protein n=1 Tax=Pareuzebyella sediminis TaxID=2607998 RepID=UPI0011F05D86|nr:hypothetical protein [Pareuzebyella sediminis]